MNKVYLTTIPLQGRTDLESVIYQRSTPSSPPICTRFPIIQVIHDTLGPDDTASIIAIRQENADTARNFQFLLDELSSLGIPSYQVRTILLPEDQHPETLIRLCQALVDALPQVGRVYACITYGSKSIPVVTLSALSCAQSTHTELEVGGIYYGEILRQNGVRVGARLCDVSTLYHLAGLVSGIHDSSTAEEVFRQLLWMSEHQEVLPEHDK